MTVKILSSTSTFNGVSYNTNKTQSAKGELMTFKNFGYLQTARKVTPTGCRILYTLLFLNSFAVVISFIPFAMAY
ncbi:hypothetical protein [Lunatibacter salilacus]|uniref:hypothetical protein n=1 Tax=Lunatibacter salilacus TaxID=2483804 RepID=UPI00131DF4CF|nr:hypothetical protein [Lunatibacter salilacus]